jgi:hypothetical protein
MSIFSKDSAGQSHATASGPAKHGKAVEMPYPKNETNYEVEIAATRGSFRVYKRRFFGLFQLVLLNIIISWDVCLPTVESRSIV